MSFYLVRDQEAACDYSIRCGQDLKLIKDSDGTEPVTMREALKIVIENAAYLGMYEVGDIEDDPEDYFESGYLSANCSDEASLQSARILKVTNEQDIDIQVYQAESAARIEAAHAQGNEASERAEFARLKEKFE